MWPVLSKFERATGKGPLQYMTGVQLARTDELTLLGAVTDFVLPDGLSVNRNSVITKVSRMSNSWNLALELKGYPPPAAPDLDLRSMRGCLQDLQRKDIFVALHYELDKPEVAYLGDIISVSKNKLRLRCVTAAGEREKEVTSFSIAECTRVDFLGEYERAIQLSSLFFAANGLSRYRKKVLQEPVRQTRVASHAPKSAKSRLRISSKAKKA